MTGVRGIALAAVCIGCSTAAIARAEPPQAAGQPSENPPSAIEQALIDHVCGAARVGGPGSDTYHSCLEARLRSLRADFGTDLTRLSSAERRDLDTACSRARLIGREDYVGCISTRLEALRAKRTRTAPSPVDPAAPSTAQPEPAAAAPPVSTPAPVSRQPIGLWIGGGIAAILLAVGGLSLAKKSPRPMRICKSCGAAVNEGGDLCSNCRHAAAASHRRANAERVEQQQFDDRARADDQRRQAEQEEHQQRERATREEDERQQRAEQARQEEEEARKRAEDARPPSHGAEAPTAFDPYAILGVSNQAARAEIDAAYARALAKYDVEQVVGLGGEMEEHYKAKIRDIERAYAALTA